MYISDRISKYARKFHVEVAIVRLLCCKLNVLRVIVERIEGRAQSVARKDKIEPITNLYASRFVFLVSLPSSFSLKGSVRYWSARPQSTFGYEIWKMRVVTFTIF